LKRLSAGAYASRMKKAAMEHELLALRREIGDLNQQLGIALETARRAQQEAILARGYIEQMCRSRLEGADRIAQRALDLLAQSNLQAPSTDR
jgi:hypothetical protein